MIAFFIGLILTVFFPAVVFMADKAIASKSEEIKRRAELAALTEFLRNHERNMRKKAPTASRKANHD